MSKSRQKKRKEQRKLANRIPVLWSVPIPKHNLPAINGKVRLYHYTTPFHLDSILKHGLIKGDVLGSPTDSSRNWNAPNLTSEGEFHNPANRPSSQTEKGTLRLEIYLDEDDSNIINYGWFDKTYCKSQNRDIIRRCNADGKGNGNIDKQYLYKGAITPKMIKKISLWNNETGYFDRLDKSQIHQFCTMNDYLTFTYMGQESPALDYLRMVGHSYNDWTGSMREFYKKTDEREVYSPLYKITDFLCSNLKGKKRKEYESVLTQLLVVRGNPSGACQYIEKTYEKISGISLGETWKTNLQNRVDLVVAEMDERENRIQSFARCA